MNRLNQFQGCLVGGAIGDALGYAVEFYDEDGIFNTYGKPGITQYDLVGDIAEISDDTQMTLFTAVGLLMGEDYISQINECYLDWLSTQMKNKRENPYCWLHDVKELHSPRAPGGTCLNALMSGGNGTMEDPINDSKGCGGVMRVAPIGFYCKKDEDLLGATFNEKLFGPRENFAKTIICIDELNKTKEKMFKPIIQEKQNKENQTLSASIVDVYIDKRKKSL